jgi:hypothetical protein
MSNAAAYSKHLSSAASVFERPTTKAYVYVLRSGTENIFKIGRTRGDVDARIRQLSTGNPYPFTKFEVIETEHDTLCESYLHRLLSTKRINSGSAHEFFAITPTELIPILDEVRTYLDEQIPVVLEANKIAAEDSDGSVKTPGNEAQSIYQELLELGEQTARLNARREYLEGRLKVMMGKAAVLEGIASWQTQINTRLDQSALKQEEPETFDRYLKESKSRPFRLNK